jgi:hypothetical protein
METDQKKNKFPWRKFKMFLPLLFIYSSPWTHKIGYTNILLAWPELDHGAAHAMAIGGSIISLWGGWYILTSQLEKERRW